jgi:two-component system nitrate/nitrite response regulator NarL
MASVEESTSCARIRLYLLDDHALFREGLVSLLSTNEEFELVGASGSVSEALRQIPQLQPEVLILDYDLGEQTAVQVLESLGRSGFIGKILLVTAGLPDRDALALIRNGVSGIFHKLHAPADLQRCIREVAQGRTLIEQEYLRGLIASATSEFEEPAARFTGRDRDILRALMEGLANKEIASQLRISESAVKASIQSLFAKTGVRTRSQLVRIALEKYVDQLR